MGFKSSAEHPCRRSASSAGTFNVSTGQLHFVDAYMSFHFCRSAVCCVGLCTVKKGRYSIRPASLRESRCQEEFDVHYADIEALPLRGEWQSLPPLRMLSFGEILELVGALCSPPLSYASLRNVALW